MHTDSEIPSSQSRRTIRARMDVMMIETQMMLIKLYHMFLDTMSSMQNAKEMDSATP